MTIARIYFDMAIPIDLQFRSISFEAEHGWSIVEEEPGRVRLRDATRDVTVDGHGYVLHYETSGEGSSTSPNGATTPTRGPEQVGTDPPSKETEMPARARRKSRA